MTRKLTTGITVVFSAVAMLMTTAVGSSAFAVQTDPGDDGITSAIASVTSVPDTGNLHITKLTPSSESQQEGNGTQLSALPKGSKPIQGVKFTAVQVQGIDLKTNEGWKKAADVFKSGKLDSETAPTKVTVNETEYQLSETKNLQTTGEDGKANFTGLATGLYLVYETLEGTVNIQGGESSVDASRITPAKPFFVTIPMTDPENHNKWLSDIYVYPKNELAGKPSKKADDDAQGVGSGNPGAGDQGKSIITYTLSATVPAVAELKAFNLIDKYKTDQLQWIGDQQGTMDTVKVGDTVLNTPADYTFSAVKPGSGASEGYSFKAVEISKEGLKKLAEQYQGKTLTWTFHAKVLATHGATHVSNTPYLHEKPGGWTVTEPGQPGPEVKTYYGKVVIHKKGESDKPLPGAKFKLYECSAQGFTDPANQKQVAANWKLEDKNQVFVDGKGEWETNGSGDIEIDGLLVNDFRNNSKFVDGKSGTAWATVSHYCLKETQAPAGYELLPNPIKFQITSADGTTSPVDAVLTVHNNKTPGLPVTGGTGIFLLVTAGVVLLGGSGAYAFAAGRKRQSR